MDHDPEEILKLIGHFQTLAKKLAKLAESQQEAVHQKELDTLEAILNQKQVFIDQLLLSRKLTESHQQSAVAKAGGNPSRITEAFEQLEKSIKILSEADQACIELLKDRHQELGRQLRQLTRDRQATNRYSQTQPNSQNRRIDISS
jgi:hypothetical protein